LKKIVLLNRLNEREMDERYKFVHVLEEEKKAYFQKVRKWMIN